MPLLSIALPIKEYTKSLEASLASCFSSTFDDYEILAGIQEPFSLENSHRCHILLKNSKVRIIDCSAARNLPQNLNLILAASSSPFVVRHDDDDLMHPKRLERLAQVILHGEASHAVVLGQTYRCLSEGRMTGHVAEVSCLDQENRLKLLTGPCFAHPAVTLNMSKLQCWYDEDYELAQDYKLYVDNYSCGAFVGDKGVGTYYSLPTYTSIARLTRRRKQLGLHDKAMSALWRYLLGADRVDEQKVTYFRRRWISKDDLDAVSSDHLNSFSEEEDREAWAMYEEAKRVVLRGTS